MSVETHANRAYAYLREQLIAGQFEPGCRLLYGPIGKEIGVSATPVREAAGRLANEGLVDLVPNMGAIVRKLTRDELSEIYEVRQILEPATAALAASRAKPRHVAAIKVQLDAMQKESDRQRESGDGVASDAMKQRFDRADYQFHALIIKATGNEALMRTASQSHVLTRIFGIRRHTLVTEGMRRTCEEHQEIWRAIERGDAEAARAAAAAHIEHGRRESLAAMDRVDESTDARRDGAA